MCKLCKYCANFSSDPKVNYCLHVPHPVVSDYACPQVNFDGCVSSDLVVCPTCLFSVLGRFCICGFSGFYEDDCRGYFPGVF